MSNNILKRFEVLIPFTRNINKRIHGRGITKSLSVSQKTIQNRLNQLGKEGILKSDSSGRTKQFTLNKENVLTDKALVVAEIKKFYNLLSKNFEIKEILTEILLKTGSLVLVYGSFARDNWDKNSDLDVLVMGKKEKSLREINEKYSREIHFMFVSEKEFKEGIKEKRPYINEILKDHVICRGFEEIILWRFKYE